MLSLILNVKTLEEDPADGVGKKKLVITEEHFQRVTQALVMKLRQQEESAKKDGTDADTYLCSSFFITS